MTSSFDSRYLRKHLLASRFIIKLLDLPDFISSRNSQAELRRSAEILARARNERYGPVLSAYFAYLKKQDVAARTARLYLRAAEAFCAHADISPNEVWRADQIIDYLKKHPGHRASLGRFVTYCRKALGWDVKIPPAKLWKSEEAATAAQIKRLRKVLQSTNNVPSDALTTKDVARVLSIALGVPAARLLRERNEGKVVVHEDGGIEITDQAIFKPGHQLHLYAQRWADLSVRSQSRKS